MIGGVDLKLSGPTTPEDIHVLLRVARTRWRTAFVETGDGDRTLPVQEALRIRWSIPCELFFYESVEAWRQWTEHGFTEDGAARMISVTVDPDAFFFVVNAPGSPSANLVDDIKKALLHHRRSFARGSTARKAA